MGGDLLNISLQKSFPFQPLVVGCVNEFVCQQPKIIRAVSANNDTVGGCQTAGIRWARKRPEFHATFLRGATDTDRYQFPSSRIGGYFRDSEKRFGFRSLYVSSSSGFDLATAALYLLEILAQTRRSLDRQSMA